MFQKLNTEDGLTIILVTHDRDVARYARRVIHIHDGVIANGAFSANSATSLDPSPESVEAGACI